MLLRIFFTGEITEENLPGWNDYKDEITEVYVEDGVTYIGTEAFMNCPNLKKAVVGNTVKTIERDAFSDDPLLTDLALGNSLEKIGEEVFWGSRTDKTGIACKYKELDGSSLSGLRSLQSFEMEENSIYSVRDGILYKDNGKTLLSFPGGRVGEYRIPEDVTSIAEKAFAYTSLTKVTIPGTVKKMGAYLFLCAEKITTLIFEKGIKEIPDGCCYRDSVLEKVVIPEGVTSIGNGAFVRCPALKEIMLPSTVAKIDDSFDSTTKIKSAGGGFYTIEDGTLHQQCKSKRACKGMLCKSFRSIEPGK